MKIITHDGTFHTDEVFAISLLKMFFSKDEENIEIIRTRDLKILQDAVNCDETFVVDVGREYNKEKRNFDHHQRNFNKRWPDNTLYSSCGLTWMFLKSNGYLSNYKDEILKNIEEFIIKKIDAHDNGQPRWIYASLVSNCNREKNTKEDFEKALGLASIYLDNAFYQESINYKKFQILKNDLDKNSNKDFFISSEPVKSSNVLNYLSKETKYKVIIYNSNENGISRWYTKSIKRYLKDGENIIFEQSLSPEKLRGLSDEKLSIVSGVKDSVFVHRAGFLAVSKNKQSAIEHAKLMIS